METIVNAWNAFGLDFFVYFIPFLTINLAGLPLE